MSELPWILTSEEYFLLFRLCGPGKSWLERGWTVPDLEKVDWFSGEN